MQNHPCRPDNLAQGRGRHVACFRAVESISTQVFLPNRHLQGISVEFSDPLEYRVPWYCLNHQEAYEDIAVHLAFPTSLFLPISLRRRDFRIRAGVGDARQRAADLLGDVREFGFV